MQIMTGDAKFTLRFWKWTEESQREILFNDDKLGSHDSSGNVIGGTYSNWRLLCLYNPLSQSQLFHTICNPKHQLESDSPVRLTRCVDGELCESGSPKWPNKEATENAIELFTEFRDPQYTVFNKENKNSFSNYLEGWDPDRRDLCINGSEMERKKIFCGISPQKEDGIPRRLHNTVIID